MQQYTYILQFTYICKLLYMYLHPSSGAHITVSTVSGIIETVTATCRECEWMGTPVTKSSKVKDGEKLCEIIVKKRYSIGIFFTIPPILLETN